MRILLFFSLIFVFGCKSKEVAIAKFSKDLWRQPGQCYLSQKFIPDPGYLGKVEKPFVLELLPIIYEQKDIYVGGKQFINSNSEDTIFTLPVMVNHFKMVFNNERLSEFTYTLDSEGFFFCCVEVPASFKRFTKSELEKSGYFISQKVVKCSSQIKKRYVRKRPKKLKDNQYFFESGAYTELRLALKAHGHHHYTILEVQTKLVELGYKLEKNDQFDDKTKAALIDFQKKNGFPEGTLNFETLKKLAIDY